LDKLKKREYDRKRYLERKEDLYESQKRWRKETKGNVEAQRRRYYTPRGRLLMILNSVKGRAKSKGLDYDLSPEWILNKWEECEGKCEITGIEFVFRDEGNRANPYSLSLDRVDNTKGYTKENVQLVVWIYNAAKATGTHEQVVNFSKKLLENDKT
jgi:hypothetical protein